jgi:hypothetical protein
VNWIWEAFSFSAEPWTSEKKPGVYAVGLAERTWNAIAGLGGDRGFACQGFHSSKRLALAAVEGISARSID